MEKPPQFSWRNRKGAPPCPAGGPLRKRTIEYVKPSSKAPSPADLLVAIRQGRVLAVEARLDGCDRSNIKKQNKADIQNGLYR